MTALIMTLPFIVIAGCFIYLEKQVEKLKERQTESEEILAKILQILTELVEREKKRLNQGGVWPAIKGEPK